MLSGIPHKSNMGTVEGQAHARLMKICWELQLGVVAITQTNEQTYIVVCSLLCLFPASAATVDVLQLQQMLDAYYLEQHQKLANASTGAKLVPGPGGILSMRNTPAPPASPVAAAGWGASGSGGAVPPKVPVSHRRMTSAPGTAWSLNLGSCGIGGTVQRFRAS